MIDTSIIDKRKADANIYVIYIKADTSIIYKGKIDAQHYIYKKKRW